MNQPLLQPMMHAVDGTSGRGMRVASLCGSIKPLFSGTDDFHDNLVALLRKRQFDVRPIDREQWGLTQVPGLLRMVGAEKPDIILIQYPTDAFGAALGPHAFCALQRLAPLVVTLHEFAAAHPVRRASLGVLLARSAAIVMTSELETKSLLSLYPWFRSRTRVIPIGANFPARDWQPATPPLIVYFGQIRPEKGLEDFIACRDQLAPRFPDAEFAIAGSRVPKFASYYGMIEAECARRGIRLRGEMPPDEVTDYLRTATVALLPFPSGASFRRGSLLAAAVCGVPVVTLHGADTPPEITRLLRPAASRDQMVEQVAACLSDPGTRMDAHSRSCELAALISWDAIGDRYAELFRELTTRWMVP